MITVNEIKKIKLEDGTQFELRHLSPLDSEKLGNFFEGLGDSTRKKYGPHPLTKAEALSICPLSEDPNILRFVVQDEKGVIIGYFLLSRGFRYDELFRYKGHSVNVLPGRDYKLAPVIADEYQNRGIGGIIVQEIFELLKKMKVQYLILWMGVQSTNDRAIHFYNKFGFEKLGEFEKYEMNNYDMYKIL